MAKITKWAGIVMFAFFVLILLSGRQPISRLFVPSIVSEYSRILGNPNEDLRGQRLGIGDLAYLYFSSGEESLNGEYALENVVFILSDDPPSHWKGKERPKKWKGWFSDARMKSFTIKVKLPIPKDKELERKSIKGNIHFKVIFPATTESGFIADKFTNYYKNFNNPISIHVFSSDEIERLSRCWQLMGRIWFRADALLFFLGSILLIISFGLNRSENVVVFVFILALGSAVLVAVYLSEKLSAPFVVASFLISLIVFFFAFGLAAVIIFRLGFKFP